MKSVVLTFAAALAMPLALAAQNDTEVTFDRVHLRNGNVVDGNIVGRTPSSITLKILGGEMTFRASSIDWIERVKMKSLKEPAAVVEKPKESGPATAPGTPRKTVEVKAEVEAKVLHLLKKWRSVPADARYEIVKEMLVLGPDAAVVLLRNFLAFSGNELQHIVEPVVTELKPEGAASLILPGLASSKSTHRATSISMLGALGEKAVVPQVMTALKDEDVHVRSAAIGALQKLNAKEAIDAIAALGLDADPNVRTLALGVVIDMCSKNEREGDMISLLSNALDRSEGRSRADAALAFGRTKKLEAVAPLVKHIADDSPMVRSMVLLSLANLGFKEASGDVLDRMEVEQDNSVRVYVASAVEKLHLRKGIPILIKWMGDPDEGVRTTALRTLKAMTGQQNLGIDPSSWQVWWDGAKGND